MFDRLKSLLVLGQLLKKHRDVPDYNQSIDVGNALGGRADITSNKKTNMSIKCGSGDASDFNGSICSLLSPIQEQYLNTNIEVRYLSSFNDGSSGNDNHVIDSGNSAQKRLQ